MDLQLDNQWVLVTGSSRGIGRGIVEAFLREKANVILVDRDRQSIKATADAFTTDYGRDRVRSLVADLQQPDGIAALTAMIREQVGRLDHLICNIGSGASVPPLEEDMPEFQRMLDLNLLIAVRTVNALRDLLEAGAKVGETTSSITFIGSICGVEALGCPTAYAAAKAGLIAYAKNIARPLGQRGVRVNVVSPGNVLFPGSTWEKKLAANREAVESMLMKEVPLQRLGTLDEIADVVVFLASRRAAFVSGANWVVDGGQVRSL